MVGSLETICRQSSGDRQLYELIRIASASGAAFGTGVPSLDSFRTARDGVARMRQVAEQWKNTSPERLAGRLAEEHHALTFNIDTAAKGLNTLRATTGAANGASTTAADITITRAGRVIDQAQVKYHATPVSTTFHVADVKYDGMQRIVPSDQVAPVRQIAEKRGVDAMGKRNYPDVATGASDRVRSGAAESIPLSRDDALAAARNPEKYAGDLIRRQVASAVKKGAITSAVIGGGISAISNLMACVDGKKSAEDATIDMLKDTAACGITGAAVSGAAVAAESLLVRAGAGALARGSAPVAIGLTVVDVGKDVSRLVSGHLDGEQFVLRAAGSVAKGGLTWGSMEGGAVLGTLICPGVGTVVGGIIGGLAGGLLGGWLFD